MSQNFVLAFLLLIFSPSISAQDSTSIDELIVTATKTELSADQVIAPVVVLDQLILNYPELMGLLNC